MTTRLLHATVLALSLTLLPTVPAAAGTAEDTGSPLVLDAEAIKAAGIVVDVLTVRAVSDEIKAPGEVKVDAYNTVLVTPRVASQVIARKARLGDVVAAGAPLVALSSVEVAETQGQLIVADQDWQRVASLGVQAVSARRYNEALVQRDQAKAKLKAYGLSDGQIASLIRRGSSAADGSFELLAPHAGRVTTDSFLVGERIEPGRPLFTLVTEASVWVEAHLSPAFAEKVKEGDPVTVVAHGADFPGKVVQRSHQTDEKTRTVDVRIQVPNEKDLLHPGELVEARIAIASATRQLAVPAEAVVLLQNQATVFVRGKKAGQFEPVAIRTGDTRDGWTEVKEGLAAGVPYVRIGAFALKARMLRSQLGDD
jgi:cobalt-zinc-cadmium efflux system membrane fusion protein